MAQKFPYIVKFMINNKINFLRNLFNCRLAILWPFGKLWNAQGNISTSLL